MSIFLERSNAITFPRIIFNNILLNQFYFYQRDHKFKCIYWTFINLFYPASSLLSIRIKCVFSLHASGNANHNILEGFRQIFFFLFDTKYWNGKLFIIKCSVLRKELSKTLRFFLKFNLKTVLSLTKPPIMIRTQFVR